ncbi:MAG: hypothetical protein MZV63_47880 [Marinilabiliales bacterium]|nr:hypothetical protein [Marinilabiliales bacterium]
MGTMLVERTIDILTVLVLLGITLIAGSTMAGSFLSENVIYSGRREALIIHGLIDCHIHPSCCYLVIIAIVSLFQAQAQDCQVRPFFSRIYSFYRRHH